MSRYLDCWISSAKALFSQALAGEPQLVEGDASALEMLSGIGFVASISGELVGQFAVIVDPVILDSPLLGEGVEQGGAWEEFLREVAEAAAGELLAVTGMKCRVDSLCRTQGPVDATSTFRLTTLGNSWSVMVQDELKGSQEAAKDSQRQCELSGVRGEPTQSGLSAGVELLLDVELEASLRFGCCEMPLGEILELGPGDVVELDRHVSDPVDLIVGDKIVARGDVVLVNGNFGLRVTEVAAPQKRLESIRCLF
jgi:flagellar motor switch protein FliN/FliY